MESFSISGILVAYDLSRIEGKRVVQALVRCADCRVPRYEPIENCKFYGIVMSAYIANGGDGYTMISENAENKVILGM